MTPTEPTSQTAITVSEFCEQIGIGRAKFYEEVKLGRINAKKSGRRTLVPSTELKNYLDRLPDLTAA